MGLPETWNGTQFIKSTDLKLAGAKSDLLAKICTRCGSRNFISPPGSREYIENSNAFEHAGITVEYFEYKHPVYKQFQVILFLTLVYSTCSLTKL